jgi:type I restriction enzyme M protein
MFFIRNDLKDSQMSKREFHINCVETVKQSLIAFIESYDFEDAIRNAIAMGGDSDTIGAITGGIAAAYYGIPEDLCQHSLKFLDDYLINIHDKFYNKYSM